MQKPAEERLQGGEPALPHVAHKPKNVCSQFSDQLRAGRAPSQLLDMGDRAPMETA